MRGLVVGDGHHQPPGGFGVMAVYVFRCAGGYRFLVRAPMEEAVRERRCPCGQVAQRVFTPPVIAIRPENYSAHPEDPKYWEGIHDDPPYLPCHVAPVRDEEAILSEDELRERCKGVS